MKIVADANIPVLDQTFCRLGDVVRVDGREITRDIVADADMLLVRSVTPVDKELLEGSSVRFVGTATIGTDHVNLGYLREQSIGFASAPGSNARSVAEYVICAILWLCSRKHIDLTKAVLGIVGVGSVGSGVLHLARALGITCLLNDPPLQRRSGSGAYISLAQVLAESDIITVHVPLTSEGGDRTLHMVDRNFSGAMKSGAILINSSRGKVVHENSLKKNAGRLGGIVLDVWESEPDIDLETLDLADIATPHIAGYSFDGKLKGTEMVYHAACAFLFKKAEWSMDLFRRNETRDTINLRGSKNPILDAVTAAYPIMEDDARLRKIKSRDASQRGRYFDELRKNYPQRREFGHYIVRDIPKGNGEVGKVLGDLGFGVAKMQ
jgi:erythronate-4-phosphate dehydrogenase